MVRTPLTLAALATSAVPGLDVSGFQVLNPGNDQEDSVVLDTTAGRLLVQLPRTPEAEVHHSAKMMGQAALTAGVRESLPFSAPAVLGVTRSGDTRAVVSTYIAGHRFAVSDLTVDAALLKSVATTLRAIHALPIQTVTQQGLPNRTMQEVRSDYSRLIERAAATGFLPEVVKAHWLRELADQPLWDSPVTVVHGTFSADTLLVAEDQIVAVLDWAGLAVDDPARDFAWLCGAAPGALEAALAEYAAGDSERTIAAFTRRARFSHEVEVAKWLLYGTDRGDESVINDAVLLLDQLVGIVSAAQGIGVTGVGVTAVDAVVAASTLHDAEFALAQTPHDAIDQYPTDRFDALDDDRMFASENDFGEAAGTDDIAEGDDAASDPTTSESATSDSASSDPATSNPATSDTDKNDTIEGDTASSQP